MGSQRERRACGNGLVLLRLAALLLLTALAAEDTPRSLCGGDAPEYSGFLPAGQGDHYFYWLAESRSRQPSEDPLILWMTGGPGCSSTLAALTENGPCGVRNHGSGGWETVRRPWSWTEAANVVWVDQPGGVGFSSQPSLPNMTHNEKEVADNMFFFLHSFYKTYPRFWHVPLFIFGESYAGHYVPAVAARILRGYGAGAVLPLTGVGIGNGLVSPLVQFQSKPQMAYTGGDGGSLGQGVVDEAVYSRMKATLPECERNIKACQADQERDQATCLYAYMNCTLHQMLPVIQSGRNPYDLRKPCEVPGTTLCYNESLATAFFNDPVVQEAFGIPQRRQWAVCNLTVTIQFVLSGDYFRDFRPQVVELLGAGIGVLVYSGDDDFMVDWLGTRTWMENLQWPHQEAWAGTPNVDFILGGRSRGMVRTADGLTFVQIYDAGHLVPMDQPEVALAMVREFISPGSRWRPRPAELLGEAPAAPRAPLPLIAGCAAALLASAVALARLQRKPLQPGAREGAYYLMA